MNFRFLVEIDGIQRGGFARVKGIAREIKVDTYREGGVNDYEHKFINQTTYGNLVLERGLVDDFMWGWHDGLVEGDVKRRPITIVMRDSTNNETWRWLIDGAMPVKWSGTDLDAASSQIVVESIELAHRGFRKGK
ncbi:phage tail protein [Mesorhizobium sp. M0590]|uniref:phage tail protein n=1 Tax=Mesorhizobium sp. M0590 TaxID=2956966 RepID=UPI00333685EB